MEWHYEGFALLPRLLSRSSRKIAYEPHGYQIDFVNVSAGLTFLLELAASASELGRLGLAFSIARRTYPDPVNLSDHIISS